MTVFTNVSDDVLEPGDPIRSVDILAIKENTNYNHQNTVLEILQEDIFTTSGTFTKATGFDDDDTVMIFLVGGGAGGGAVRLSVSGNFTHGIAGGGSAGQLIVAYSSYSEVPSSSFTLTAGAGGAGHTSSVETALPGIGGGLSMLFNASAGTRLTAFGGQGGNGSRTGSNTQALKIAVPCVLVYGITSYALSNQVAAGGGSYLTQHSRRYASTSSDPDLETASFAQFPPIQQFFSSGGTGVRFDNTQNRPAYNPAVPALFGTNGGAGSGTANGQNATGIGSGGGGAINNTGTVVSGNGFAGGMIVRYYRGRVSPWQVFGGN